MTTARKTSKRNARWIFNKCMSRGGFLGMLLFACACLPGVLLRDLCLEVPVGRVTHFALSEKRFRTLLLCLLAPPPRGGILSERA